MTTLVYSSANSLTVTNLHSLANSATAGWGSAEINNTSTIYIDAWVTFVLDPANTAAANSKSFFVYAYGGVETGMGTTGATSGGAAGSEGALTFPDVTTNPVNLPLVGVIPYVGQDIVIERTFAIARAFPNWCLPPFWGVALLNHSGAALAATGNSVKWVGVTVA